MISCRQITPLVMHREGENRCVTLLVTPRVGQDRCNIVGMCEMRDSEIHKANMRLQQHHCPDGESMCSCCVPRSCMACIRL